MSLPNDLDAEEQVIGSLILEPMRFTQVSAILEPDDFYSTEHKVIYQAIQKLVVEGKHIDVASIARAVKRKKIPPMKVRDVVESVAVPAAAPQHAASVMHAAVLRRLVVAGSRISELASDDSADMKDVLGEAERLILDAGDRQARTGSTSWSTAMSKALDALEFMASQDTPVTGVPTGFGAIDHRLMGLHPGGLYILAARPGDGKTALALQIAMNAAKHVPVAFFSLEMAPEELAQRAGCLLAGIPKQRFRHNLLKPEEWRHVMDEAEKFSTLPIEVFDESSATSLDVAANARRVPDVGLIVVDYIGLLRWHRRVEKRYEELSEISRHLKLLARSMNVPVLACAQMNRNSTDPKTGKIRRPNLSDLRDSGALEQDADVVMFLHSNPDRPSYKDLITAKHRAGAIGDDSLRWEPDLTRFSDAYIVPKKEGAEAPILPATA